MMAVRKGGYPGKEAKKPKMSAKKPKGVGSIVSAPTSVEVIKRKRTPKAEDVAD